MKLHTRLVLTAIVTFTGTAHADPLPEFQSIVSSCKKAYDAVRPLTEVVQRDTSWLKRVWGPASVSYDVRKTDSLVTPFSAFIEVTEVLDGDSAPSETEAKAIQIDLEGRAMRTVTRIRFAYQDGSWQLVDARISGSSRSARGEPFRTDATVNVGRDDLLKRPAASPIRACLG